MQPDQGPRNLPGPRPFESMPPDRGPNHASDEVRLAAQLADGQWLIGRFRIEPSFPLFLNPLFLSQIALFVILLTATLFWASRISRPMRILADESIFVQTEISIGSGVRGVAIILKPTDLQSALGQFKIGKFAV